MNEGLARICAKLGFCNKDLKCGTQRVRARNGYERRKVQIDLGIDLDIRKWNLTSQHRDAIIKDSKG